jgi:hypothetical protein
MGPSMSTELHTLPAFWAGYLMHSDRTGLTDRDIKQITAWEEHHGIGPCLHVSPYVDFRYLHGAALFGVLPCQCHQYTFKAMEGVAA